MKSLPKNLFDSLCSAHRTLLDLFSVGVLVKEPASDAIAMEVMLKVKIIFYLVITWAGVNFYRTETELYNKQDPALQFDQSLAWLVLVTAVGAIVESLQFPVNFHIFPHSFFTRFSNLLIVVIAFRIHRAAIPRAMAEFAFCVHFHGNNLQINSFIFTIRSGK